MANDHPFQLLFETLGRVPAAHAEPVNRQAYEILCDILTVPLEKTGRCILLRAPRAGHGKTHLLSRIQHQFGAAYEFIPLHSTFGSRIDAASVMDDTLRRLVRQLPASGGLTVLDLVTRRLFAAALQPLVSSGEVPCQDREGALTALRARPIETFDFHHPNAVTAHWARENFEVLGQRLSLELAQRSSLPVGEVGFWVDVLFRFAAAPLENSSRLGFLAESIHSGMGLEMARLEALLGMLTQVMRVVLVADDLEGFSADETAALRLAAFLGALRQSVERLDVILSINQDIWQSAFVPRLSGGLVDRLSEIVVELEPLKESEMAALLDSRVPGLGSRVLARINVGDSGTHARGLIRAAGMAWLKATAMDSAPAPVMSPAFLPSPVVETVFPPVVPSPFQQASVEPEVKAESETPVIESARTEDVVQGVGGQAFVPALDLEQMASSENASEPEVKTISELVVIQAEESSPIKIESPAWTPDPPVASFAPPVQQEPVQPPVAEAPAPSVESPFQVAAPQYAPEPATASFAPPVWQPPVVETPPPVESPFQVAAPQYASEPAAASFAPPVWQPPVVETPPPLESPFQVAATEFSPPAQPVEATAPPTAADTDRVDDLLRQFRERYGRGSL